MFTCDPIPFLLPPSFLSSCLSALLNPKYIKEKAKRSQSLLPRSGVISQAQKILLEFSVGLDVSDADTSVGKVGYQDSESHSLLQEVLPCFGVVSPATVSLGGGLTFYGVCPHTFPQIIRASDLEPR